ncbi:MAG: histidine kinase [Flavobacteriales bacterium]
MKISQNKWFWLLQTLGWGSISGIGIWAKLSFLKDLKSSYIFAEGLIIFSVGLLISSILRYFFKKNIQIGQLQKINYLKLIFLYVISSLTFATLLLSSIPVYTYLQGKEMEINTMFFVAQYLNSFIFFFLWMLLYFGIKMILKFRKEKLERLELEASLKESQLNTLKGQINPHFMFNSLNNIRGLMLEDIDKSREMITRLSEMLRYSLMKTNVDGIALEDNL